MWTLTAVANMSHPYTVTRSVGTAVHYTFPAEKVARKINLGRGGKLIERGVYDSDLKSCANMFQEGLLREELLDVVNRLLTRVSQVVIPLV